MLGKKANRKKRKNKQTKKQKQEQQQNASDFEIIQFNTLRSTYYKRKKNPKENE